MKTQLIEKNPPEIQIVDYLRVKHQNNNLANNISCTAAHFQAAVALECSLELLCWSGAQKPSADFFGSSLVAIEEVFFLKNVYCRLHAQ